jgi:tRNA threonylcarbamoyladenosine biosynthesis protein TsaB
MLILSLDTTTRGGSAAVVRDGRVLHEQIGDSSLTHGQRLPAELMRLLETADVRLEHVDLFAVAAGPGSFTGLRVGVATIQGLALAGRRRVVPVSVLDALARTAGSRAGDRVIAPWMDAQRGEVFAAIYEPDAHAVVAEPTAGRPEITLDAWAPYTASRSLWFVGDGAVRYRDLIATRLGDRARVAPDVPPLAGIIGIIASERAAQAILPHAVVPIYIRRPDAELARARRAGR